MSLNPKKALLNISTSAQLFQFAYLSFICEVDIERTAVFLDVLLKRAVPFYCMFSISNIIDKPKLMKDRPVEKWHVVELKRFLRQVSHHHIQLF